MTNPLREKLRAGKRLLGTHVNLTDYRICEMLGSLGFDYLWIDMEHLSTSLETMEMHLIAARAAGCATMVRVSWNDVPHVKRVLETGPDAVVFPMINSVEEARRAIDACIYPPEGKRGFGPFRAMRYGLSDVQGYIHKDSKQTLRFLQVETAAAVEAMDQVAQIPFVDGFIIGPMDLSGSVGELGQYRNERTDGLIREAIEKARRAGLPIGLSTGADTAEELAHWLSKGIDFLSAGTDAWSVLKGAADLLERMRGIIKQCPHAKAGG